MPFTKQSNRLDDALIAGHITYDQYLAAGGRTPATTLKGLREGSDALVKAKKIREIRKPYDQLTDQDFIRLTLRREGLNGENDEFIDDFYKNLSPENKAKVDSLADVYRPDFGRGPHTDARFWEIYTPTDASMSVLRGKPRVTTTPLEAEYEAELIRRHEIDEKLMQTRRRRRTIRRRGMDLYEKYKPSRWEREEELRLRSFGHNHPRVIVNEHSNLVRAPEPVRKSFYDARTETKEVPSYKLQSGGDFEYGRGINNIPLKPEGGYSFGAAKHRLDKALADRFPLDYEKSLKFRLDALEKAEELASKGRGRLLDDVADLAAAVVKHSEYNSNNTPFTKQSNRLDDALMAGHITHDQYLSAGGRPTSQIVEGLREGNANLIKKYNIHLFTEPGDAMADSLRRMSVAEHAGLDFLPDPSKGGVTPEYLDEMYNNLSSSDKLRVDLKTARVPKWETPAHADFIKRYIYSPPYLYNPNNVPPHLEPNLTVGDNLNAGELVRRHEIDEIREGVKRIALEEKASLGSKRAKRQRRAQGQLLSQGHVSPEVIFREQANVRRLGNNVTNLFLDLRDGISSGEEARLYKLRTGGSFDYGRKLNNIPVKRGGGYDFKGFFRSMSKPMSDPWVLASRLVKHSEYNTSSKPLKRSNNTPFTKQSNRLDDALIAGHITHDQYLAAGGRTPETMLRGLREGSDALVKRHGIREIRSARDLVSPEPHRRAVLKEMIQSPGMGGAALGSDDWRAMWRLSKTKTFDDASLDDLYSKLDRKGHPFRDLENEVNPRVKHFRRSALENFISLKDVEARNAHSLSGSHIYTPTAKTDTLGTKLRNLVGRERNPFEADFEAELIRRHEIDEARYHGLGQKNKKTLRTFGHAHPRVILNEHGNLARAPKNVRDVFLDVRNSVYEAPAYNIASGGKFEYGKGFNDIPVKPGGGYDFNAAKRAIENSIADAHFGDLKASQNARREAVKKVLSPPSLLEVLRSGIRGVGKQSITNALSRAPDASLLGRLSNFIIKHSEYAPSNKSHLKTAYEMGAQEALRRAGI